MTDHSFNIEVAQELGINPAIVFRAFCFWIQKNAADNTNFKNGEYWTYASAKSLTAYFPYFTARQIAYAIDQLVQAGYLKKDQLCDTKTNRTNWYALDEKGKCIYQIRSVHSTDLSNGHDKTVQCNIEDKEKKIKNEDISSSLRSEDKRDARAVSVFSSEIESFVPDAPLPIDKPVQRKPRADFNARQALLDLGCIDQVITDFLNLRNKKRASFTKTALDGFIRESHKAGIHLNDALVFCCETGWTGFRADWYGSRDQKSQSVYDQTMEVAERAKAIIFGDSNAAN